MQSLILSGPTLEHSLKIYHPGFKTTLSLRLQFEPTHIFFAHESEVVLLDTSETLHSCKILYGCKPSQTSPLFRLRGPVVPAQDPNRVVSNHGDWWAVRIRTPGTRYLDATQIWESSSGRSEVFSGIGVMAQGAESTTPVLVSVIHGLVDLAVSSRVQSSITR